MTNEKRNSGDLADLCREVELSSGFDVRTPKDFDMLSEMVFARTKTLVSPSTLKRLWGYVKSEVAPREGTLSALARFVGYSDWGEFRDRGAERSDRQSGILVSRRIDVDADLRRGDRLRLTWAPGRICDIVYLGERRFRIERAVATSLRAGATFTCSLIIIGEPLYLDNVSDASLPPTVYVCGKRDGIRFEFID